MMERERFRKVFPHLAEEIESDENAISIDQVQPDVEIAEKKGRKWVGYNPSAVDFIRRCDTCEQAEEIIYYMERRCEITPEKAHELRKQLSEKGLRSFGEKKKPGFYHQDS